MILAFAAGLRSTCLSRRVGCVIVRDGQVIATGYNGTPARTWHPEEFPKPCPCVGGVSGADLSLKYCAHAEANALAQSAERPVAAAANMVVHPMDTVTGLPSGIGSLFGRVSLGAEKIASSASNSFGSGKAAGQAGNATMTALGYDQVRRDLARKLHVDPYSSDPILTKKLNSVAWVMFSARLTVDAAMMAVPASIIISGVEFTNELPKKLVERLRQQKGKHIWMMGGGEVIRDFLKEDLIDEFYLGVIPVLIGEGIPLIAPRHRDVLLQLHDSQKYPDGVVRLQYRVTRPS